MKTLAFDIYGTLIDTHGVIDALAEIIGAAAPAFSQTWRDKQLEYTYRRGLMQHYDDFAVCTAQALDFTCAAHDVNLSDDQRIALLQQYRRLPAFADAPTALQTLHDAGHRLYAFSNGSAAAVDALLTNAGLRAHFTDIVSVDEIKTFKPNPAVYRHFLRRAGTDSAWLVSSNPFDVIGAISAGMTAAWVRRNPRAPYDPWNIPPTLTITTLADLPQQL